MDEIKINTILYTKDGRKIGNAIVRKVSKMPGDITIYDIKTDYGHSILFTKEEIEGFFHIGNLRQANGCHKHYVKGFENG